MKTASAGIAAREFAIGLFFAWIAAVLSAATAAAEPPRNLALALGRAHPNRSTI